MLFIELKDFVFELKSLEIKQVHKEWALTANGKIPLINSSSKEDCEKIYKIILEEIRCGARLVSLENIPVSYPFL